jgi:hypothetical protein
MTMRGVVVCWAWLLIAGPAAAQLNPPARVQQLTLHSALLEEDRRLLIRFLYSNWGEAENEGMNHSYNPFKALLIKEAPKGLRWTVERVRAGDHQQTQVIALPSALHDYFAGHTRTNTMPKNRTARATSLHRRSGMKATRSAGLP